MFEGGESVSIEPASSSGPQRARVNVNTIVVVASLVVTVLLAMIAGLTAYVGSQTHHEDSELDTSKRITELQERVNELYRSNTGYENRITQLETSQKFMMQSIADSKIQATPKHN